MILPDHEIISLSRAGGSLTINPWNPRQIQPASYDLSVDRSVSIAPGEFQLWSTLEWVELPNWLQGQIHGKSSRAREGVMVHISAGFVDPGFKGNLTLEVVNFSKEVRTYARGICVAQIAFIRLSSPCWEPYNGHYKGQIGPTESRTYESH